MARIVLTAGTVTWTGFRNSHRDWDYHTIGDLTFSRRQFENAFRACGGGIHRDAELAAHLDGSAEREPGFARLLRLLRGRRPVLRLVESVPQVEHAATRHASARRDHPLSSPSPNCSCRRWTEGRS
ncbi:hypothetical protein [Embleya sp. NBC_00896]|uniref:hypothetical protein n=1 Tax=Embleya sp. NBC_00896 TaxID=2975961 RepID=UPI00386A10F1|nr:hypothetical protein OG928_46010 [Embleya sp. NBC_00896]